MEFGVWSAIRYMEEHTFRLRVLMNLALACLHYLFMFHIVISVPTLGLGYLSIYIYIAHSMALFSYTISPATFML